MNRLSTCVISALLSVGSILPAHGAQSQSSKPQSAERVVTMAAAPACEMARSVAEQLGKLAPQLKPLPNERSFAAANGVMKLVVACGISADETYTYQRLLAEQGIDILPLTGDEPPQKVVRELADRLNISYRHEDSSGPLQTFLFTGQGLGGQKVRLAIRSRQDQAPSPAKATAAAPPPAAETAPAKPVEAAVGHGGESLFDLYLLAKANDPDLGRSQSRFLMSQADTDASRAGFRPRVSADFGMSWINQTTLNNGPTATSAVYGYNYELVANMPLLHVSTFYNVAAAEAAERSDGAGIVAARQGLILKLGQAYFGVLKARGDAQIAREEIFRVKQAMDQARAFLNAGTGDIIAVFEAQARLDSVTADLNRAESTFNLSEQKLSSIVGRTVTSIADLLPSRPVSPDPDDVDWWLTTMEARDPQIRQALEGLAGSIQQSKSSKADHLPVVDANAGFDVSKGAAFAPAAETHQWHVGATISLPIYSGGETSARIRRAYASETERRYALDQMRELRRDNLKQAFFNLRYNVSLIKSLEQKQISALVQLNAVKKGRDIGTRTAIDLLNAEDAYSVAQRDLKGALYDNVMRMIDLKAAAGTLSEDDIALGTAQAAPALSPLAVR